MKLFDYLRKNVTRVDKKVVATVTYHDGETYKKESFFFSRYCTNSFIDMWHEFISKNELPCNTVISVEFSKI